MGTLRMCTRAGSSGRRLTESVLLAEASLNKITYQTTRGSEGRFSWQIQTAPTGMDNLAAVSIQIQWLDQQKRQEYRLHSLVHIPVLMEGK